MMFAITSDKHLNDIFEALKCGDIMIGSEEYWADFAEKIEEYKVRCRKKTGSAIRINEKHIELLKEVEAFGATYRKNAATAHTTPKAVIGKSTRKEMAVAAV